MSAPLYALSGVERREEGRVVLDVPELSIEAGMITAMVGPNGAGKSTLLRVLALLDRPDTGELRLRGERVARGSAALTAQRRTVTMVGQTPYLFHGSVFDNVALGLKLRGMPRSEWRGCVEQALERVELAGTEAQPARSLSGGEARRVAIARALAIETPVLLLDEPFANVDRRLIERLEDLVREVNRERGTTVIFATHDLTLAHGLGQRTIQLARGRLVTERHDNLFSGVVQQDGEQRFLELAHGRLVLEGQVSGAISCTVRPEDIEVVPVGERRDGDNVFSGTIQRMELRGERARLRVDAGMLFRVELPLSEVQAIGAALGCEVQLCFPASRVRII